MIDHVDNPLSREHDAPICTGTVTHRNYKGEACTNEEYVPGSGLCYFCGKMEDATKAKLELVLDARAQRKKAYLKKQETMCMERDLYKLDYPGRPPGWSYILRTDENLLDAIGHMAKQVERHKLDGDEFTRISKLLDLAYMAIGRRDAKEVRRNKKAARKKAADPVEKAAAAPDGRSKLAQLLATKEMENTNG